MTQDTTQPQPHTQPATAPGHEPDPALRQVEVTRLATGRYRATNARGTSIEFGSGPDLMSPVELLLAAVAGCAGIDVDVVTSRRSEPMRFDAIATGRRVEDEGGAVRLDDLAVDFHIDFPDDDAGRTAAGLVQRLLRLSHEKNCTVSRTLEHGTPVALRSAD